MTLTADQIIDRRRLKRRLSFWRIVALLAVLGVIGALAFPWIDEPDMLPGQDYVARLEIKGLIVDDRERERVIDDLADDDNARAVILRINSTGGTVAGSETLYHALRRVAAKKPVVAVMGEVAASGGYMAALGADHIIARSGTITGSIGVLMQSADLTGLLEKLGIKPELIKSGPLKAQPNSLEPLTPEAREASRAMILDIHAMFVDMVAERRAMDRESALALADGRIFSGRQARENGLVDAIGGAREARAWLEETHDIDGDLEVKDVAYGSELQRWRRVFGGILGKTLFSEGVTLDGLISVWHPEM